jgi:hypothetical protein
LPGSIQGPGIAGEELKLASKDASILHSGRTLDLRGDSWLGPPDPFLELLRLGGLFGWSGGLYVVRFFFRGAAHQGE